MGSTLVPTPGLYCYRFTGSGCAYRGTLVELYQGVYHFGNDWEATVDRGKTWYPVANQEFMVASFQYLCRFTTKTEVWPDVETAVAVDGNPWA